MKISLVLVTSINGKLTNAGQPSYLWASAEDQVWFEQFKRQSQVIVMGRETYESARQVITLSPKTLRFVLSRQPEKYQDEAVARQLEFSSLSPVVLVDELKRRGYKKATLVGGAQLAASFLQAKLVTDLYLTLEPVFFSQGLSWEDLTEEFKVNLQLEKVERLNERGTLLLKYSVIYPQIES